jgi:hypothetical protein
MHTSRRLGFFRKRRDYTQKGVRSGSRKHILVWP